MKNTKPYAYLITYRTYASWLHGDSKESIHHTSTAFGAPKIPHNETLQHQIRSQLPSEEFILNKSQREIALLGIQLACKQYHWRLFAAHVRTNHVHLVVQAPVDPARVVTQTKAYATRHLRKKNLIFEDTRCWARHGSTQYIWLPEKIYFAMHYVVEEQGEKMACFFEEWFDENTRQEIGAILKYS